MPSSFWYFLMMSPVITYFVKLSSIRSKGRYFSLFTIITGKIFAGFRSFLSQNEYFDLSYPSRGHSGTKRRALRDQGMGINRPSGGHLLPVRCAQSAQKTDGFWALLADRRLCFYA